MHMVIRVLLQSCNNLHVHIFYSCIHPGVESSLLYIHPPRIPEITELWRDMIQQPQKLSPQFTGESVAYFVGTHFTGVSLLMNLRQ